MTEKTIAVGIALTKIESEKVIEMFYVDKEEMLQEYRTILDAYLSDTQKGYEVYEKIMIENLKECYQKTKAYYEEKQ